MKKINITLLLLLSTVTLFAQVSFESILPPAPSPQINPIFEAVDNSAMAFADVDGNGTQDVLITGLNTSNAPTAKLYANKGGGNYEEIAGTPFDGVSVGSVAFADVDGNGSQDVVITGLNLANERTAKLYLNDGTGTFTEVLGTPFDGVIESSIAFADVDGDETQDLFITGRNTSDQQIGKLYLNDGNGVFTEDAIVLGRVNKGSVAFADVNGNGSQDLMITGLATIVGTPTTIADLYINDGSGVFTKEPGTPFTGVQNSSIAFGFVDNNSSPDLLITGVNNSGTTITELFTNGGSGDFTKVGGTPFEGVREGAVAFSDVDGVNGDDILITGLNSTSQRVTKLFINNGGLSFTLASGSPFVGVSKSTVAFSDIDGDAIEDLVVTGQISASDVISKIYTNDGSGNFYEATGTPFEGVRNSAVAIGDINGDGTSDVLITGRNSKDQVTAKLYTNDGNGVYTEVTGTGFKGVENGSVAFADVDGVNGLDILITGFIPFVFDPFTPEEYVAKLYLNNGDLTFTDHTVPFVGVQFSSVAFADVNGDSNLDVLITGQDNVSALTANLYLNKGDGSGDFLAPISPFTGVRDGSVAFADVDGGTGVDVLITGRTGGSTEIAELYINNGSGTFTLDNTTPFDEVRNGAIAFADVDGVASQDVLITGFNTIAGARIAKLYTNNGSGTFTLAGSTPFTGVNYSTVAFADVDGNGSQDVLISGAISGDNVNSVNSIKLYTNSGGTFTEAPGMPFDAIVTGEVAFADVAGSSLVDVLITGKNNAGLPTAKIYKNTTGEIVPTITSGTTGTIAENATGTVYNATADESVTFSLGTFKDEEFFTLSTNAVSFSSSPDFENPLDANADNIYFIDVIATNGSGNSTTKQVAITVTDVNEDPPVITSAATASVAENLTTAFYTATADKVVTFSLGNTKDESFFTLATDQISFTAAADFENPLDANEDNFYLVDVIATDGEGLSSTLQVTVEVTDVVEPGPVFTSGSSVSVAENSTGTVYTITTDVAATYTLGSSKDEAFFTLSTDVISFTASPDFEDPLDANGDNTYVVDVIATDGGGNSTTLAVSISVTNEDDLPPVITSPGAISVAENSTGTVYTATADKAVTFSLGSGKDAAFFSLETDNISFINPPNFENPLDGNEDNVYIVDVIATDGASRSTTLQVGITVTDIAETPPTITSANSATVAENVATSFYTVTSDVAATFSLGNSKDEAFFTLTTDAISFTNAPDFENPLDADADNIYLVDVIASDEFGNSSTSQVAISVTNVDEPGPTITSGASVSVAENSTGTIYTITTAEAATYSIGNTKDEAFFNLATDQLSFISSPDFENPLDANADNVYLVDIIAADGEGNTTTLQLAVSVTNVEETGPVITSGAAVSVEENITTAVYTITADVSATFTLGSSKDEALFNLSAAVISFKNAPDFESPLDGNADNVYLLDVIATDGGGNSSTLQVAITVTDVIDEVPTSNREALQFTVYPNPFKNSLVVKANNNMLKDAKIVIMDLSGKQHAAIQYNGGQQELDLSGLDVGVYIMAIPTATGIAHYKLVKE